MTIIQSAFPVREINVSSEAMQINVREGTIININVQQQSDQMITLSDEGAENTAHEASATLILS